MRTTVKHRTSDRNVPMSLVWAHRACHKHNYTLYAVGMLYILSRLKMIVIFYVTNNVRIVPYNYTTNNTEKDYNDILKYFYQNMELIVTI